MTEDNIAQGASEGQVRGSPGRALIKRAAPYDTAKKFVTQARSPLIHYHEMFYEWTGTHYQKVEDGQIRARIYEFLDDGFAHTTKTNSEGVLEIEERPFRPDNRDVNKVIDALKARVRVSSNLQAPVWGPEASPEQCKHKASDILACSNGLLDLTTGELLHHSAEFFTMNAVDYPFDETAEAPLWEKFLEEILPGDIEAQQTIEEMLRYLLTADTTQQKAFALIGKRRSGKGTISRVLDGLLGGAANVAHPTMASLKTQFGLAALIDKKVATIGDARLDGSTH
jgi:putative DNA primase/helicase